MPYHSNSEGQHDLLHTPFQWKRSRNHNLGRRERSESSWSRAGWKEAITTYLTNGTLPENKLEAKRLKYMAPYYTLIDKVLYKWGFSLPYLKFLDKVEADYVLREIREGDYRNHVGCRSLVHKVIKQGYYWPTMKENAKI